MTDETKQPPMLFVQPWLHRSGESIPADPVPFQGTTKDRASEIFYAAAGMLEAEFPPRPDTEGQLIWLHFGGSETGISEQIQLPITCPVERISGMMKATLHGIAGEAGG